MILGIDPGLKGALAWLSDDGDLIDAQRIPGVKIGSKRSYSGAALAEMMHAHGEPRIVVVEKTAARPGMGAASMHSLGRSLGALEGLCWALGYPLALVPPATWKRAVMPGGASEAVAAAMVAERYPALAKKMQVKANWGMADALLMAEWWRRKNLVGT